MYTATRIRCYIDIIQGILTYSDSCLMKQRKYGLHVFIESLYNDIGKSYSKKVQKNYVMHSPVFCPSMGKYGAKSPSTHSGFM